MDFGTAITAGLAVNMLTAWFIYGAWTVTKVEKQGGKASDAPWLALLGLITPPALGLVFYSL